MNWLGTREKEEAVSRSYVTVERELMKAWKAHQKEVRSNGMRHCSSRGVSVKGGHEVGCGRKLLLAVSAAQYDTQTP